jgi:hypothetical protein
VGVLQLTTVHGPRRLQQREALERGVHRSEARLVDRIDEAHRRLCPRGDVVVARHQRDGVEVEALADQPEQGHDLGEQAEAGVSLARQRGVRVVEADARVLQQQPLHEQHLVAGHQQRVAPYAELYQQVDLARVSEDAQQIAGLAAGLEIDVGVWVAQRAQVIDEAEALQRQLHAVARVVVQQA